MGKLTLATMIMANEMRFFYEKKMQQYYDNGHTGLNNLYMVFLCLCEMNILSALKMKISFVAACHETIFFNPFTIGGEER